MLARRGRSHTPTMINTPNVVKALKIQKEFLQMKMQIITYLAQDYSLDEAQANEINELPMKQSIHIVYRIL